MNINEINTYLERAREIIGDRSGAEIAYDNSVVVHLSSGMDLRRAVAAANLEHPDEALKPGPEQWDSLVIRYDYIRVHTSILKKLGIKE